MEHNVPERLIVEIAKRVLVPQKPDACRVFFISIPKLEPDGKEIKDRKQEAYVAAFLRSPSQGVAGFGQFLNLSRKGGGIAVQHGAVAVSGTDNTSQAADGLPVPGQNREFVPVTEHIEDSQRFIEAGLTPGSFLTAAVCTSANLPAIPVDSV